MPELAEPAVSILSPAPTSATLVPNSAISTHGDMRVPALSFCRSSFLVAAARAWVREHFFHPPTAQPICSTKQPTCPRLMPTRPTARPPDHPIARRLKRSSTYPPTYSPSHMLTRRQTVLGLRNSFAVCAAGSGVAPPSECGPPSVRVVHMSPARREGVELFQRLQSAQAQILVRTVSACSEQ